MKSFKWTDAEYTPLELMNNFGKKLPLLARITIGYLGDNNDMEDLSVDEMLWIKDIARLSRLVVINQEGICYSIPVTCNTPVLPVNVPEKKRPVTLKTLLIRGMTKCFAFVDDDKHYICPATTLNLNTKVGTLGTRTKLGTLRIVDRYEERYLLAYTVGDGEIYHEPTLIPIYIPIKMVIAFDMTSGDRHQFHRTILQIKKQAEKLPKDFVFPETASECNDILMFKQKPRSDAYDVTLPYGYLSHGKEPAQNTYSRVPLRSVKWTTDVGTSLGNTGYTTTQATEGKAAEAVREGEIEEYTALIKVGRQGDGTASSLVGTSSPDADRQLAISELAKVPHDLSSLDGLAVGRCLVLLGLERHVDQFRKQFIDGQLLKELDGSILQAEFGFTRFETFKLQKFVGGWRPK